MCIAIFSHLTYYMKARHSKQVLVRLSVFSDGVLHFLQVKKKFFIFLPKLSCGFNSAFEVQFSDLHFHTLSKTLVACRDMQLRKKGKILL